MKNGCLWNKRERERVSQRHPETLAWVRAPARAQPWEEARTPNTGTQYTDATKSDDAPASRHQEVARWAREHGCRRPNYSPRHQPNSALAEQCKRNARNQLFYINVFSR